ncbi:MAG: methyltransferase [Anaeroplasmataceae bacterium]|nr:methyltransferase [Anaeroplasmataceae bacterium]
MVNHHYYEENQDQLESNPNIINFTFQNLSFKFHTDNGVFSKKYIDYGSLALLKSLTIGNIEGEILDMGAGYGALGIIIAKLYSRQVLMCEINTRAVQLIKNNIAENKITNAKVYHSNLYDQIDKDKRFAYVVTNPPIRAGKQVVYGIYDGAFERLLPKGELWVVIQKKQGAPSSKEYLMGLFGNCEIINRDKGYYILKSVKNI